MADQFTISIVPPEGDIHFGGNAGSLEDQTSPLFSIHPLPPDLIISHSAPAQSNNDFQDAYTSSLMGPGSSPAFSNFSPLGTSASVTGPSTPLMDSFSGISLSDNSFSDYYSPPFKPDHWRNGYNSTSLGSHGLGYGESLPSSSSCPLSPISMPSDLKPDAPADMGHSSLGLYLTDGFDNGNSALFSLGNDANLTSPISLHDQRFLPGFHGGGACSFNGFDSPSTPNVHSDRAFPDRRRHSISVFNNHPGEQLGLKRSRTAVTRNHRPYDKSPKRFTALLGSTSTSISPHHHHRNFSDEMTIPSPVTSTPNSPNHWQPTAHGKSRVPKDIVGSPAIDKASSARRKKEALFQCHLCYKSLTTKQNLQHHINAHNDERNYTCERCNKAFVTPTTLNRHSKTCHP
ncbi:hypothetical protein BD779DRAFT_1493827 [Infundibulicybe gibba]|nr:hypothetical protein BD779DRAFT_1493827 [Infundibulicybe gibba]